MTLPATTDATRPEPLAVPLATRLVEARRRLGFSREHVAERLGVGRAAVLRWERGTLAPPADIAAQIAEVLGVDVLHHETNARSIPLLRTVGTEESQPEALARLRGAATLDMSIEGQPHGIELASYVVNGPPDQRQFHDALVQLQVGPARLPWKVLGPRLALVARADGAPTAQSALERPRASAVSWNSNYGSHGWHRYVGRFPPHLVRALLNSFGAGPESLVCDPFAGSGTTLVECRLLGIPAVGVEISPLSALISRTKSCFPTDGRGLRAVAGQLDAFFAEAQLRGTTVADLTHDDVLSRDGNLIQPFPNVERWFTPGALLGVSLVTEFAATVDGFERDAVLVALSSKMRSIGNVDVDVVRAEYRKTPRQNVDVRALVLRQLQAMAKDVEASMETHGALIGEPDSVRVHEGSLLQVPVPAGSISHIVTSPPYGVESLSYFRTHLLSFRTLEAFLSQDPYVVGTGVIGSEYLDADGPAHASFPRAEHSRTYREFFSDIDDADLSKNDARRVIMMMKFFDDMACVAARFAEWLMPAGRVAFVIGNKRLGARLVPTADVVTELFAEHGLILESQLRHKLKTNNSNSVVPWQERIINDEYVLVFRRHG